MKKTITSCFFLLLAILLTILPLRAQAQSTPINSTDREKINAIAVELLQYWDSKALINAVNVLSQMDNYDTSALSKDVLLRMEGLKTVVNGTPDYRLLFGPETFTGHFKVVDGKWVKMEDAKDLQFIFPDEKGATCVLSMTRSGDTKTANLPIDGETIYDVLASSDIFQNNRSILGITLERISELTTGVSTVTVVVPASTVISLQQGDATLLKTAIDVDLESLGGEEISGLVADINTEVAKGNGEGYNYITLKQTGLNPKSGAHVDLQLLSNDKKLVSIVVNVPLKLNSFSLLALLSAFSNAQIDIDVLGKVQVKGKVNIAGVLAEVGGLSSLSDSELLYKAALEAMNLMFDVDLYYDGSSKSAGSVKLKAYYDKEDEEWTAKPVITFASDKKTYALEEFFTPENFPEVAQSVNDIADEIQDLAKRAWEKTGDTEDIRMVTQNNGVAASWYTLDGKPTTPTAKGLKIARMADGSVRKVVVK